ncbi:MAG: hypothetical protein KA952_09950 [Sediminibacterium sp.]|nr:hypothetical protein [Sediminibacterium sp.]
MKAALTTDQYRNSLKERIFELSNHSILLNLETYFADHNKDFYGVLFNPSTNHVESLFGNTPIVVLEFIKINMVNAMAGFKFDLQEQIPGIKSSDLLLISEELLSNSSIEIDTILIHELTHLAINSDNVKIELVESDRQLGHQFYKASRQYDCHQTHHDETFCNYLVGALRIFNEYSKAFQTNNEAALSGFRFDLPEDFEVN